MNKINGADLMAAGFKQGKILGEALAVIAAHLSDMDHASLIALMSDLRSRPEQYLDHPVLEDLATKMIEEAAAPLDATIPLNDKAANYKIYGEAAIDPGAIKQMDYAMRLPVTVGGALMPDAHQGYGLPIGGVLAAKNAVIPYGVGVDIGCRMALSIYDIPYTVMDEDKLKKILVNETKFGAGHGFQGKDRADHAVLDNDAFNMTPFVKQLKDKAWSQLGSSGGGNHFVEFGVIEFAQRDEALNINAGQYLALLSHSGSRGFGATIAGYYTRLAKDLCKLPKEAANLAWLDMHTAEGQEYWMAMNLAGDYAAACHQVIHRKVAALVGGQLLATVENHHNFAWKEQLNGEEVIVHRKGATPAGKGVMGIIPGSMAAPGFLVRGKGEESAINSASHGAGRQLSRTRAEKEISKVDMAAVLAANNVTLIGAGLDEAPMAYKDIHAVMAAQDALVDVVAKFSPRIVRMADDGSKED
ncbi:RtcB family protein [Chitinophaga silvisoli]|uniref:3'-phosphate/5'-hydroxy nucleic acid ligase n=1 Tax=Chitinophaga silvisoli TaxID=2291814 RepID=A0A3E1NWB3_9BACT|nr:RtcB family protein [Chitinophaga silvisoli]RFM32210.1 RtcB family protein [Chitinophaga silvisoli]